MLSMHKEFILGVEAFEYNIVIYQYNVIKERSSFFTFSLSLPSLICRPFNSVLEPVCHPKCTRSPPLSLWKPDMVLFGKMFSIFIRFAEDNKLDGNTWNSLYFISGTWKCLAFMHVGSYSQHKNTHRYAHICWTTDIANDFSFMKPGS